MNASASPPAAADDLEHLAALVIGFSRGHAGLIAPFIDTPGPPPVVDALAHAALNSMAAALEQMAATPARTPVGWAAKARALATCIHVSRGRPDDIRGDAGLAASLVRDLADALG